MLGYHLLVGWATTGCLNSILWSAFPILQTIIAASFVFSLISRYGFKISPIAPLLVGFPMLGASMAAVYYMRVGSKIMKHRGYTVVLNPQTTLKNSLNDIGADIKKEINSMSQGDYRRVKMWKVTSMKAADHVSRGYSRLCDLLHTIGARHDLGRVIEIGVGRGGWTQYLDNNHVATDYTGYSLWSQAGQEPLMYQPKQEVFKNLVNRDIRHVYSKPCDTLLMDMGENHDEYQAEVAHTIKLLDIANSWLKWHPSTFCIRVPNVINDTVVKRLQDIQAYQRSGTLVRLSDERNSVATVYFCSGPMTNLRGQVDSLVDLLYERIVEGLEQAIEIPAVKTDYPKTATWPVPQELPVPKLVAYDMSETIKAHGPLEKPRNHTSFLKEVGWKNSGFSGNSETYYNRIVTKAIGPLKGLLPDYGLWRTTSTHPFDTYSTVKSKVDHAPCENHRHFDLIWACYQGILDYINDKGLTINQLSDEEIMASVNPIGAMGWQDHETGFTNMGDYIKHPEVWKAREKAFERSLINNKPIHGDYNSIGKRERKQKKSSRLIWFLSATARIHETRILAGIDKILKKMPFSVSGLPLYDYGEALADIMTKDRVAVCDDIAGWDTKVPYSILCMECEFLKRLATTEEHKKAIERLYRLYAYPVVGITRPSPKAKTCEMVLFKLQGQVASGRRVTYSMNTFTNAAITMARSCFSRGVTPDQAREWVRANLHKGHTKEYGGKISGDDSAIIMDAENAKKFATIGAQFMNEIGFPRKDMPPHEPSRIITDLANVDFCSHNYTRVMFKGFDRWLPIRDVGEIIAKASIMVRSANDSTHNVAWARAQGLNLLVNYFHIPSVRILAQTILSMTPDNIALDGTDSGWSYRIKPWIQSGDPLRIINQCLFGGSTKYPRDYVVESMADLPYINRSTRNIYDVSFKNTLFRRWKNGVYKVADSDEFRGPNYHKWVYDYSLNEIKGI